MEDLYVRAFALVILLNPHSTWVWHHYLHGKLREVEAQQPAQLPLTL